MRENLINPYIGSGVGRPSAYADFGDGIGFPVAAAPLDFHQLALFCIF
jgi:hypothetical protein